MKAHIIAIGDELLIGQTLNSNAAFIGRKLTDAQVRINGSSMIPDDEDLIKAEFRRCLRNNDIVIVTGGLGPTHDDITKKCITDIFESDLILNEKTLSNIRGFFERRGRNITKLNENQALIPEISEPLTNTAGTAPGIWIEKDDKIFIAMPGVPFEMQSIMEKEVIPRIEERNLSNESVVKIKNILTTGIPESTLFQRLVEVNDSPVGKIAYLPNQFGVKLRITVEGADENEALNKLSEMEQQIRTYVGRYVYGKDDDLLEQVVGRLLGDRQLTIAVAESCTGGLISNRLTNISGSSEYFERGFISYSNGAKVEHLHVDEDILDKHGAVSMQVARQMAEGVRATAGTDIGVASTGIMGPTGATADKPVGLAYIGLCDEKICTAKEFRFGEDRLLNKDRTSQAALDMLRRHLLGIPYDE